MSLRSLVSAHTIIGICGGEFVPLLDPPEDLREIAASSAGDVCAGDKVILSGPMGGHGTTILIARGELGRGDLALGEQP